jgi:hypothetical protein
MLKHILPVALAVSLLGPAAAAEAHPVAVIAYARDANVGRTFSVDGTPQLMFRASYRPVPAHGDLNGDGVDEVVTASNGIVTARDGATLVRAFQPYSGFRGGLSVAVGDVNGDGRDDIVTGASTTGGPHVKVFDGATGALIRSFLAGGSGQALTAIAAERGIIAILIGAQIKVIDGTKLSVLGAFLPFGGAAVAGVAIA